MKLHPFSKWTDAILALAFLLVGFAPRCRWNCFEN